MDTPTGGVKRNSPVLPDYGYQTETVEKIQARLTTPDDVGRCIVARCHPATYWMTGNTLRVDGGESIVG